MRNVAGRLVPLVAVVAGACDAGSGAQSAGVAVRDSAGIRIVQSSGPAWQEEAGWQIELSPFVVIGVVDGDAMQQLFRVSAATRLADGTIVIADAGSPHVRWYAASGEFLKGTGRSGEGPGEFSDFGAGGMCRPGEDFLLVSDPMQARANVFTVGGEFSALVRAPAVAAGFPSIQGCFAGGTLQLWHAEQPAERIPDTMMENVFVFTRIDADGTILNELARHRTRTQYLLSTESGGGTYHSIPFTVRPSGSTFGERFFFTAGADPEIEVRRPDGTLEALWQWTRPRTRSRDVVSRYERHTIDAQQRPEQRTQWARFFALSLEPPEYIAVTASLAASADGHLWAERYRLPWDSMSVWDVFAPDGAWLGGVRMPDGLRVLEIQADAIVGVRRDENDVEQVVAHRILRQTQR